jgi:hypothetical protein
MDVEVCQVISQAQSNTSFHPCVESRPKMVMMMGHEWERGLWGDSKEWGVKRVLGGEQN